MACQRGGRSAGKLTVPLQDCAALNDEHGHDEGRDDRGYQCPEAGLAWDLVTLAMSLSLSGDDQANSEHHRRQEHKGCDPRPKLRE
jgi:hypothetical protein